MSSTKSLIILWLNFIVFFVFALATIVLTVTRCTFFEVVLVFQLCDMLLVYRFINLVIILKFVLLTGGLGGLIRSYFHYF